MARDKQYKHLVSLDDAIQKHFDEISQIEPPRELMEKLYDNVQKTHLKKEKFSSREKKHKKNNYWGELLKNYAMELSTLATAVGIFFLMQLPNHSKIMTPNKLNVQTKTHSTFLTPHKKVVQKQILNQVGGFQTTTNRPRTEKQHTKTQPHFVSKKAKHIKKSHQKVRNFRKKIYLKKKKIDEHRTIVADTVYIYPLQEKKKQEDLRRFHARYLRPRAKMCLEQAKQRNPFIEGKLSLSWMINQQGRSRQIMIHHNQMDDSILRRCIFRVINGLQYPKHLHHLPVKMSFLAISN